MTTQHDPPIQNKDAISIIVQCANRLRAGHSGSAAKHPQNAPEPDYVVIQYNGFSTCNIKSISLTGAESCPAHARRCVSIIEHLPFTLGFVSEAACLIQKDLDQSPQVARRVVVFH